MKKVLLIISFVISATIMFAQTATLEIQKVYDPPAGPVNVSVRIMEMTNIIGSNKIAGISFYIKWDRTILSDTFALVNIAPSPLNLANWYINITEGYPTATECTAAFIWSASASANPTVFPFKFFDIQFPYPGLPAASPVAWTNLFEKGNMANKFVTNVQDEQGNEFLLTLNDGFVGPTPSVGTPGLWTGALSSDWDNPGNWDDGNVPPPGINIEIPNVGKAFFPVILGGPIIIGNLTMLPLSMFTIAPGGQVTTLGVFTNTGGSFKILSDNTGKSGSYIDSGLPGGIVGLGGATFEFDRNTWWNGDPTPFGDWHYISSPMGNTGAYGPTSGFENWDFLDYFALTWNAGAGAWAPMGGGAPNCIPAAWAPIQGMDAWAINWDPTYTSQGCPGGVNQFIQMVGDFNLMQWGPYNAPAVVGPGGGNPPFAPGWNMYGNPYPSALDVTTLNYAGFQVGVAYFDPQIDQYRPSTLANGWLNGNVAPTQGFMMQANIPGLFGVTNANRTHDPNVVWKSESGKLLTLEVNGNGKSDQLWVNIDFEGAVAGYDIYDFSKLFSEAAPQIYTITEGHQLSVNALPATPSVPMEFTSGTSETYTIAAIETSEFENVVLEDLANGLQTDLLAGSYTFEYSEGAVHNFVIHFTPLGTPELNANSINIWAADHNIYVQAPATTGDIVVYNLMGQEVLKTDIEAGLNVIPMTDVNTYYIVKVIGSDVTETGKVFIK